jgi:4-alpha-glucanotransferase
MRVFQFGFDNEEDPYHRPEAYPEHSAAYTGTHDNETIVGWYQQRKADKDAEGGSDPLLHAVIDPQSSTPHLEMVRAVFNSAADLAIVPLQDLLGFDNSARMNTPGEPTGNWAWRCSEDHLCDAVAVELEAITNESHRRVDSQVAAGV